MRAVQVFAICAMASMGRRASAQEIDWKKVDEALGRTAAVSGDVTAMASRAPTCR